VVTNIKVVCFGRGLDCIMMTLGHLDIEDNDRYGQNGGLLSTMLKSSQISGCIDKL
jgi:hypothetical protein